MNEACHVRKQAPVGILSPAVPLAGEGSCVFDTMGFCGNNVMVELPPLTLRVLFGTVPSLKSICPALYYLLVHIPGRFLGCSLDAIVPVVLSLLLSMSICIIIPQSL